MNVRHCCFAVVFSLATSLSAQTNPATQPAPDVEARRARQRDGYRPVALPEGPGVRQEIGLAGNWLFAPAKDPAARSGADAAMPDEKWHVLPVPQFWNEIEWWIYYKNRGTSHNFTQLERERCQAFTFDYQKTNAGWYRQWVDVPASYAGKRVVVQFDAVASAADVFWNGQRIGGHVGMFSPFECDATPHVRPGERNLLSVYVAAIGHDPKASREVAEIAVTMTVTREMLQSMPHSTYPTSMAGIWQPVKLVVTNEQRLEDVYFRPTTEGATVETTIAGKDVRGLTVRHALLESDPAQSPPSQPLRLKDKGGADRWASAAAPGDGAATTQPVVNRIEIRDVQPRLWSPEHPNLYWLKTELLSGETVVDERVTVVGFRTFETRDGKFYLNGKPYFLRGANMPPAGIQPNNAPLADRFMQFAHDGNQMVTRFHMCPPPKVWMDAADRHGVGVSIEGSWPWVAIGKSEVPDERLRTIWYEEMRRIARANRNHPSLLMITMANESHFQGEHDPDVNRKARKYKFFADAIAGVRATAVGVPIVMSSGYVRPKEDYDAIVKPKELDDGDIDDGHHYFGWYTQSPFRVDVKKDVEDKAKFPDRPLVSQEASTGYPDNDTGHAAESYIRDHRTPQIWVGRHALYDARPDAFLETHALITKEMAEKIRRDRRTIDGWGLFASTCWYRDVYDAERITPYPVHWAVRRAYEPVLISLVTANRHYEAGQRFTSDVVVCHDDPDRPALKNLSLHWRMTGKSSEPGTAGTMAVPDVDYDARVKVALPLAVPEKLPGPRAQLTLALELRSGGEIVSQNEYAILAMAKPQPRSGGKELLVLEPDGVASGFLNRCGYACTSAKTLDWSNLKRDEIVVVAPAADVGDREAFAAFLRRGTALLLEPGIKPGASPMAPQETAGSILASVPGFPVNTAKVVGTSGDFVDVVAPDLLDGLDPMDVRWWTAAAADVVRVCRAAYQFPETPGAIGLARHVQPHAYIKDADWPKFISWPVVEFPHENGAVIVSSLLLADDPVARKFYGNVIERLRKRAAGASVEYTAP